MKLINVLLFVLILACLTGCAGKNESSEYMQAQLQALAMQKPLLVLEAHEGQAITGLKRLEVYASSGHNQIKQYTDPWANVATNALGVLGAIGGIWVGGDAAVRLAGTVGAHAGPVYTNSYNQTAPPPKPVIVEQPAPVIIRE